MEAVVGAQVGLHLGSRKSVVRTNLPRHQLGVTPKPAESPAAGAGALPQCSLQGQTGLEERISAHRGESLCVFGAKRVSAF